MYEIVKEEWKTWNEMDASEQLEYRICGGVGYQRRRNGNRIEYLVRKYKKI